MTETIDFGFLTVKPCPHCGGQAVIAEDPAWSRGQDGRVWVECSECHAKSGYCYGRNAQADAVRALAVRAWNRRASQETERMGFLPCPICGDELSWRDVEAVDIRGISVPLEYPFIDRATLKCRCGFRFVRFVRDQEPGEWKDGFEDQANRRAQ